MLILAAVYDKDSNSTQLSAHDFVGAFETTLGSIMGARGSAVRGKLQHKSGKPRGDVIIRGSEVRGSNDCFRFQMRGFKLDKMDFFGKVRYGVQPCYTKSLYLV